MHVYAPPKRRVGLDGREKRATRSLPRPAVLCLSVRTYYWALFTCHGLRRFFRYIDITYYITIRRKALFHTYTVIIPFLGITMLTTVVFYLPSESNNNITLCIQILVSLTLFYLHLVRNLHTSTVTGDIFRSRLGIVYILRHHCHANFELIRPLVRMSYYVPG